VGFQPTTAGATVRCSTPELRPPYCRNRLLKSGAEDERQAPPAIRLEERTRERIRDIDYSNGVWVCRAQGLGLAWPVLPTLEPQSTRRERGAPRRILFAADVGPSP